ncbi:hypothetical protein A0J61_01524 [Choanephora cucurbitarum]|uniref:C2H2-type domain-containing protein n=1 Tax=Choanephora cucurbitarum TaxID=101091 RepID=A0A1C7NMW0_9FUNG|nr:hypothetical protein A0J61_01524 [Choanephora cucurbitarum]
MLRGSKSNKRHRLRNSELHCSDCQTDFKHASSLKSHVCKAKPKQPNTRLYDAPDIYDPHNYCRVCDRSYKTRCSYICHVRIQHNMRIRPPRQLKKAVVKTKQEASYCTLCDRSWKRYGDYRNHMTRIHQRSNLDTPAIAVFDHLPDPDQPDVNCSACNKPFDQQTELELHIQKYHQLGLFVLRHYLKNTQWLLRDALNCFCRFCDQSFGDEEYELHFRYFHRMPTKDDEIESNQFPLEPDLSDPDGYCRTCNLLLDSRKEYLNHLNQEHYDHVVHEAKSILKHLSVEAINELSSVLPTQTDVEADQPQDACSMCKESYSILSSHLKALRSSITSARVVGDSLLVRYSNRLNKCWSCSRTYSSNKALKEHLRKKHNIFASRSIVSPYIVIQDYKDDGLVCSACDNEFTSEKAYTDHVKQYHSYENQLEQSVFYRCRVCKAEFKTQFLLNQHRKEVHSTDSAEHDEDDEEEADENEDKDETDDDEDEDEEGLIVSPKIPMPHRRYRTIFCSICRIHFDTKKDLQAHSRRAHAIYIVDDCQKLPRITNGKKYCTICHLDYASQKSFHSHLRKIHNVYISMVNKNPADAHSTYYCSTCETKFNLYDHLQSKRRIHTSKHSINSDDQEEDNDDPDDKKSIEMNDQDDSLDEGSDESMNEDLYEGLDEDLDKGLNDDLDDDLDDDIDDDILENYCQLCDMVYARLEGFRDHLLHMHHIQMPE